MINLLHDLFLVEQLCLRELRERVAKGGDPTKLHEPIAEDCTPQDEQGLLDNFLISFDCSYIQEYVSVFVI